MPEVSVEQLGEMYATSLARMNDADAYDAVIIDSNTVDACFRMNNVADRERNIRLALTYRRISRAEDDRRHSARRKAV
jgi:hypothetical protein